MGGLRAEAWRAFGHSETSFLAIHRRLEPRRCRISHRAGIRPPGPLAGTARGYLQHDHDERKSKMALMNDPRKLFAYKLGTVLSGEKKILMMLKKLEKRAQKDELKQQFRHHREETEGQIRNIEQAFEALGEKATGRTNPVVMGLAEQADVLYDKTDDEIVDTVLLGGAAETEHVEIALYEDLITQARAMGEQQVVSLLQQNLEQEQHTLEEVKRASEQIAQRSGRQSSAVGSAPQPSGFSDTGRE